MSHDNNSNNSSNGLLRHRRTHNLLLMSRLLSQHQHVSPLTLVLDSVEQPARPLVREYLRRAARLARSPTPVQTILLSFETVETTTTTAAANNNTRKEYIDEFITCYDKSPEQILQACRSARAKAGAKGGGRCLIVIDSLTVLVGLSTGSGSGLNLPAFLSSLLQTLPSSSSSSSPSSSTASVVAVYHADVHVDGQNGYHPSPLSLLKYLATTIITVHSLAVLLAEKAARERSLAAPAFGLNEEAEGILVGLKTAGGKTLKPEERGIVLELEHRRKSGRGVHELYFLPSSSSSKTPSSTAANVSKENVILLDDHPRFRKEDTGELDDADQQLAGLTTFELGLTERQRLERDGVVLPYFDAQSGGGSGGGGRILYDMGVEDDFDEEEDEI